MAQKLDRSVVATLGRIGTTPDEVCGRILSARLAADGQTESAGLAWYAEGRRVARELADRLGAPVEVGAGILAAYSPRTSWRINVELAREHAEHGWASGTLTAHARKAAAVVDAWRNGCDPLAPFNPATAPKTHAFARNLSGDLDPVTVDVWALRCALGHDDEKVLKRAGVYGALAACYGAVARELGEAPALTQATTWVVVRGSHE